MTSIGPVFAYCIGPVIVLDAPALVFVPNALATVFVQDALVLTMSQMH